MFHLISNVQCIGCALSNLLFSGLQVEKEELEVAKVELEERVSTLQAQLNKMIEENGRLKASTSRTPPPSSPTTLTPTTLTPIVEPSVEAEEGEAGESPSHVYARVDYSKVGVWH